MAKPVYIPVVEAIKAGFTAEASALKSLAVAFFALPLMDRESIIAMFTAFTPELLVWAKRGAAVPANTPPDEEEVIRDTAGTAMATYIGQVRSYVTKVTLSQIPAVVAAREAYGRGEYPINLRAAYNLALGKKAHGGGRAAKEEAADLEKVAEAVSKASSTVKADAIVAIFKSLSPAEQSAVLTVLHNITKQSK